MLMRHSGRGDQVTMCHSEAKPKNLGRGPRPFANDEILQVRLWAQNDTL